MAYVLDFGEHTKIKEDYCNLSYAENILKECYNLAGNLLIIADPHAASIIKDIFFIKIASVYHIIKTEDVDVDDFLEKILLIRHKQIAHITDENNTCTNYKDKNPEYGMKNILSFSRNITINDTQYITYIEHLYTKVTINIEDLARDFFIIFEKITKSLKVKINDKYQKIIDLINEGKITVSDAEIKLSNEFDITTENGKMENVEYLESKGFFKKIIFDLHKKNP